MFDADQSGIRHVHPLQHGHLQGWFWKEGARPKTVRQVARLLATVNARNSNSLLNPGPDKQGRFEEASVKMPAEVEEMLLEQYR